MSSSSLSTSVPPGRVQGNITEFSEIESWDENDEIELTYTSEGSDSYVQFDGNDDNFEDELLLEEYWSWSNAIDQAVKVMDKKRNSLQSELAKAQGAEDTMARAQLIVSNLYLFQGGVKTATVTDWENDGVEVELTLDSTGKYDSPAAEADALFAQARKLKRGSQVVTDLLNETERAWEILLEAKLDLESAYAPQQGNQDGGIDQGRLALVKDRLTRTSRITQFQIPNAARAVASSSPSIGGSNNRRERKPELGTPASNIRKLISPGGCVVLVGRNRRGNEYLSLSIARGSDIWMHSRGCPGAHVLIQNRRGGPKVTEACLQFGADLAIFYSDLRNEKKADVTAAEPKHILKPRGAPLGAIKIREEWKTFVGRPDHVPDELKMAREGSGQTDEYHMSDKAKHRRRTKQAAEEDRMKKKQQRKNHQS